MRADLLGESRLEAVGLLRVDYLGLQILAATCENMASDVTASCAPACAASSYQATSAAVGTVHGGVATTGGLLAQRMRSTAMDLRDASSHYATTERYSVDEIHSLARSS